MEQNVKRSITGYLLVVAGGMTIFASLVLAAILVGTSPLWAALFSVAQVTSGLMAIIIGLKTSRTE